MTLTAYAKGHVRMVEIDKRFNAVMDRHPKRKDALMKVRRRVANNDGKWQRENYTTYTMLFDLMVR